MHGTSYALDVRGWRAKLISLVVDSACGMSCINGSGPICHAAPGVAKGAPRRLTIRGSKPGCQMNLGDAKGAFKKVMHQGVEARLPNRPRGCYGRIRTLYF